MQPVKQGSPMKGDTASPTPTVKNPTLVNMPGTREGSPDFKDERPDSKLL